METRLEQSGCIYLCQSWALCFAYLSFYEPASVEVSLWYLRLIRLLLREAPLPKLSIFRLKWWLVRILEDHHS